MIHNLSAKWNLKINGVYWSVGLEWQIYFLFALILLPVCRRFGIIAAVVTALIMGYAPTLLLHRPTSATFIALFGFGMGAAILTETGGNFRRKQLAAILVGLAGFLLTLCSVVDTNFGMGIIVACYLVHATISLRANSTNPNPSIKFFVSKPLVQLGIFSYSLYLIHEPVLALLHIALTRLHLTPDAEFWSLFVVGVPAAIAVAYGFHTLFERPFQSASNRPS